MPRRKTVVIAFFLVAIGGATALWQFWRGRSERRELAQLVKQYRARAERGDAKAQYLVSYSYYNGRGVPQEYADAVRWFRRSAQQGDANAQFALGHAYYYGRGVPLDRGEAIRWDRKAAEQGLPLAQRQLASSYRWGEGVPQDFAEAARWYRKAAEQGDSVGQCSLGSLYDLGEGVPQDSVEAVRWYRKAAERGDSTAQFYLGSAFRWGRGVPQDLVEAARWYHKAAAQGDLASALSGPSVSRGPRRTAELCGVWPLVSESWLVWHCTLFAAHGVDAVRHAPYGGRLPCRGETVSGTCSVAVVGIAVCGIGGVCISPFVRLWLPRIVTHFQHRCLGYTLGLQCMWGGIQGHARKGWRLGLRPAINSAGDANNQPRVASVFGLRFLLPIHP